MRLRRVINTKQTWILLIGQTFFLIYILFTGVFRGNMIAILDLTKFYLFGGLGFVVIMSSRKNINKRSVDCFIALVTFVLAFLGVAQFFFPFVAEFFVIDLADFGYNKPKSALPVFKNVVGLSPSTTTYGNLMAVLLTYVVSVRKNILKNCSYRLMKSIAFYTALLVGIFAIVLTGVRTSVVSFLLGMVLLALYANDRGVKRALFFFIITIVFIWQSLLSIVGSYNEAKEGFSNPIGRTLQLISFVNSSETNNRSTFSLTVDSFDEFMKNPIFGTGDEMKWLQYFSVSDAFLIYHAIQLGLFGLLILFFPYFLVLENKIVLIIFVVLVLQTITDTGIFTNDSNLVFWIIAALNCTVSEFKPRHISRLSLINRPGSLNDDRL